MRGRGRLGKMWRERWDGEGERGGMAWGRMAG